jgi:hypothetical protein
MSILPQASLFLGIIPALFILFLGLKGYDGYYKEKNVFLSFIIGIILGMVSIVMELSVFSTEIFILLIFLYPILEQILKLMVLNIRRLQENKSTVIYGLTLGLGFGSIYAPISLILLNNYETESFLFILSVIIGSTGMIFLHSATGILIGYGVFSKKIVKYYIISIIITIPFTAFFYSAEIYLLFLLIIPGIIIFWYSRSKIMIKILKQNRKKIEG